MASCTRGSPGRLLRFVDTRTLAVTHETTVPGLFAVGDVRSLDKRVASPSAKDRSSSPKSTSSWLYRMAENCVHARNEAYRSYCRRLDSAVLLGLALPFMARLDIRWEHHSAHFWLVLVPFSAVFFGHSCVRHR